MLCGIVQHTYKSLLQHLPETLYGKGRARGSKAAMYPCPCGWLQNQEKHVPARRRYLRATRSASPARCLIRIDIHVEVAHGHTKNWPPSARANPPATFASGNRRAAEASGAVSRHAPPGQRRHGASRGAVLLCAGWRRQQLVQAAIRQMHLSARDSHHILKLARLRSGSRTWPRRFSVGRAGLSRLYHALQPCGQEFEQIGVSSAML
jgi:hypothetical protein